MITQLLKTAVQRQVQNSLTFLSPKIKVRVNQGIIKGVIEPLPNGKKFQRFSGIPYAKPPIGELRFRAPQKLMKFATDEIDCTYEGNQCVHKSLFYKIYVGSEDCLNLNVYVPNDVKNVGKLPVMIFIPGGAFGFGSSNRDLYSPEFLLMEDVIVVTINYRLHALGFACIPEMGIYGNAGLKDQQLALEWIYENIEYFGGDITNITLFGESAGATSAHLHSLNPKSKQYFHKMILQSGSALCDWLIQADGEEKMKNLVKIMKGRNDTPKDTYESLMKIEAKKFFDHRVNCQNAEEKRRAIPVILKPVIEKESDEAFLTKLPIELIREQGKDLNIPIMIGFNNGDGMVQMEYFYDKLDKADRNLLYFVPTSIKVEQESEEAKEIEHEMRKFFFGDLGLVKENIPALNNLGTDLHYTVQTTLFNEMYRKYSPNTKQYVYQFCLDTKLNIGKSFSRARNCSGAFHTDELSYLFDYKIVGLQFPEDSKEWKYRQMMCKMWTNFAKYSNPTPDHDKSLPVKWNPLNLEENTPLNYLKITNDGNYMDEDYCKDRMDFWRKIYEKHNGSFLNHYYKYRKY